MNFIVHIYIVMASEEKKVGIDTQLHLKFSFSKCSCASYEIMFGKNFCSRECQPYG